MPSRTQIVCLHEGQKGPSIDPVFINCLVRALNPAWIRPQAGNNLVRLAKRCLQNAASPPLPPSLEWSRRNWRKLVDRMKDS